MTSHNILRNSNVLFQMTSKLLTREFIVVKTFQTFLNTFVFGNNKLESVKRLVGKVATNVDANLLIMERS